MDNNSHKTKFGKIILLVCLGLLIVVSIFMFKNRDFYLPIIQEDIVKIFNNKIIDVSIENNGETITIPKGEVVSILLTDPGFGGQKFNEPLYDKSVFKLINHIDYLPFNPFSIDDSITPGNFGQDRWNFKSTKSGLSDIKINISGWREGSKSEDYFYIKVIVK